MRERTGRPKDAAGQASAQTPREGAGRFLPLQVHAGLALLTALGVLGKGYLYGVMDQAFYVPFLLKWHDPSLFPEDFLLSQPFARSSPLWTLLGWMAGAVDLRALFLALYAATAYFTLLYVFKTARLVWENDGAAWMAAVLWLPAYAMPGAGFTTFEPYFSARLLGSLLGLMLLYQFLRGDLWRSAGHFLAGVILYVLMVLPLGFGMALWCAARRQWRFLALLAVSGLAGLGALASFWRGTGYPRSSGLLYSGEWYALLRQVAGDVITATWDWTVWLRYALYAAAFLMVWDWARREGASRQAKAVLVLGGAMSGVAFASAAILAAAPLVSLTQLSLYRGFFYAVLLLMVGLAGLVSHLWSGDALRGRPSSGPMVRMCGVACLACWLADDWRAQVIGVVLLAGLTRAERLSALAGAAAQRWGERAQKALGLLALLLGCLLLDRLNLPLLTLQKISLLSALPLLWLALAGRGSRRGFLRGPQAAVLAGLMTLAVLAPSDTVFRGLLGVPLLRDYYSWTAPDRTRLALQDLQAERERRAVEALVTEKVPREAVVLVPPSWEEFRLRTLRSAFVTWKDRGPAIRYRAYAQQWAGRMSEIGGFRPGTFELDADPVLRPEDIPRICAAHSGEPIRFVVSEGEYPLTLLGAGGRYKLYSIPPGGTGEGEMGIRRRMP